MIRFRRPVPIHLDYTFVVGQTGFEPATSWSQTKCATKLRHCPKCSQGDLNPPFPE